MDTAPTLSIEQDAPLIREAIAVMGRACANTTGWYFYGGVVQNNLVVFRVGFPHGDRDTVMWYGLEISKLESMTMQGYYRMVEAVERSLAEMRAERTQDMGGAADVKHV